MLCSPQSPRPGDGSTTSGSVALPPSPRSPSVKPRANGTSACWLPSPSCRPASLRRSSMAPRLRISRSPASPRRCPIRGPSRSRELGSSMKCYAARDFMPSPATRCSANRSLSHIEPVSGTPKRKLENGEQRLAPKTHPSRTEIPEIAGQRLGRASLTRGNVGGSHTPGNHTAETGLPGCSWGPRPGRIVEIIDIDLPRPRRLDKLPAAFMIMPGTFARSSNPRACRRWIKRVGVCAGGTRDSDDDRQFRSAFYRYLKCPRDLGTMQNRGPETLRGRAANGLQRTRGRGTQARMLCGMHDPSMISCVVNQQ